MSRFSCHKTRSNTETDVLFLGFLFDMVLCSVCSITEIADSKGITCKCGQKVCSVCCGDHSRDLKDKACFWSTMSSTECKKNVVKSCAGCGDYPLCDVHQPLNFYFCTHCGSFACEECFVEDFEPNEACKSRRGCMACGACERWDSEYNPRQPCHNCAKRPSQDCIACGSGRQRKPRPSCDNCKEDRLIRAQALSEEKTVQQEKWKSHCGYHAGKPSTSDVVSKPTTQANDEMPNVKTKKSKISA